MSEYRRFVSYIYAYNQGKKDRNVGFAKVEVRDEKLKMSIQLNGPQGEDQELDVYAFIRKEEKLYGIWLGEIEGGNQMLFRLEDDPADIKESGHTLNELAGLWIKGNHGENLITVWDDDPIMTMELEVEIEAEEIVVVAEGEDKTETEIETDTMTETEELPKAESEQTIVEMLEAVPKTEDMAGNDKVLNGVRAQEAIKMESGYGYDSWLERLCEFCPRRKPFKEGEVRECIQITPRELAGFQKQNWKPQRNSFVLQGYYQFRHLIFGCNNDGVHFLGIPGFWNQRERQRAVMFGFPIFKEAKEQHQNGRFGYWCRPLE